MSFKQVITDMNIFYAITNSGELLWYRDLKRDGTNGAQAETVLSELKDHLGIEVAFLVC